VSILLNQLLQECVTFAHQARPSRTRRAPAVPSVAARRSSRRTPRPQGTTSCESTQQG